MSISKKVKSITTPVLTQADNAAAQHQLYVDQFVTRGRQELYSVLASIYGVCLAVEQSGHRDAIAEQMRKLLRENYAIKTSKKTAVIAVVIRYITRAATKTVSVYKRVLSSAMENGVSEADLAAYITANGGVDKCGKAIASAEQAKAEKQSADAVRKATLEGLKSRTAIGSVNFNGAQNAGHMSASDVKLQYLVGQWNKETQQLEIVSLLYPNAALEEQALQVHLACCKAASLDDGTGKFASFCKEYGLNMDNVHRWMALHNIQNNVEAKSEMKKLMSLLEPAETAPALKKAA